MLLASATGTRKNAPVGRGTKIALRTAIAMRQSNGCYSARPGKPYASASFGGDPFPAATALRRLPGGAY